MNSYQNPVSSQKYLDYLESADGQTQRQILGDAILGQLPKNPRLRVLDAGCGSGWLTEELSKKFAQVQGCDSSDFLLHQAKTAHPELNLAKADLNTELPYPDEYFDIIVANMVASDVENLEKLYRNFSRIVKPGGQLVITIPNPAYAFPVGVWKRGLLGWILRQKPKLRVRPWHKFIGKNLSWKDSFSSHFYSLTDQIKNARAQAFTLADFSELRSEIDSKEFNLQYQLFRFPLFVMMSFVKRIE